MANNPYVRTGKRNDKRRYLKNLVGFIFVKLNITELYNGCFHVSFSFSTTSIERGSIFLAMMETALNV